MGQFHIREFLAHFDHHFAPHAGHGKHVGLVHGAHLLTALAGRGEGHPTDAGDFLFIVNHGVEAGAQAVAHFGPGGLAEIDAARQFAHDDEIKALGGDVGTQQARAGKFGEQGRGTQVGEQAEGLTDAEQATFGTDGGIDGVPLGAAHRAEEHRIGGFAGLHGGVGQRHAHGVDGGAAEQGFRHGERMTEFLFHGAKHFHGFGNNLGANAVTRQQADRLLHSSILAV